MENKNENTTWHDFFHKRGTLLYEKKKKFQRNLKAHHALYAFLGGVGVVMFWYGIWEGLEDIYLAYAHANVLGYIGHPVISLVIGSMILAISGLFVGELAGKIEEVKEKTREIAQTQHEIKKAQGQIEEKQEEIKEEQEDLKEEQEELEDEHEELAEELITVPSDQE